MEGIECVVVGGIGLKAGEGCNDVTTGFSSVDKTLLEDTDTSSLLSCMLWLILLFLSFSSGSRLRLVSGSCFLISSSKT